jgi:hypothetical protein
MFLRAIAPLSVVALLAAAPSCPQPLGSAELAGPWGGEHIALVVSESGATIEYDCARGTIDVPLRAVASGRFTASGTHIREHGGPVHEGEVPDVHPAEYTGLVRGDRMTLTVRETDTDTTIGTFTLRRGVDARVFKCL